MDQEPFELSFQKSPCVSRYATRVPTGPTCGFRSTLMRQNNVPSPRGAAVLTLTDSDLRQNRLLNMFLATTALGLVTIWVYLNPFAI